MSERGSEADIRPRHFNVAEVPTTDIAPNVYFIPLELTIGWGVAPKGKDR
jgi:hypothetical protein